MDTQPVACGAGLAEAAAASEPDERLLERFLSGRDEDAFALLVRRHARVIFHLCRRILGDSHDAEDALQATFLVLARKADAVRRQDALASWLCGVALRVALRLKSRRSRRRAMELLASSLPSAAHHSIDPLDEFSAPPNRRADPAALAGQSDDAAVLTEELARLPERYRAPLVLCYLEGQTTERAAVQLRCPHGTFKSRLAKARDLIRIRLIRRGMALTAAALTGLLTEASAGAAVPPALLQAAASLAGPTADPPPVAALAREAMIAPRTTRLLTGAAVAAVLAVLLAVFLARGRPTPMPPAAPVPPPVHAAAGTTLVVANQRCGTVTLIDVATGKIRVSVSAEPCPHEVAISPNGATAAVASYGLPFGRQPGNTVRLIDVATGRTRKTIDLGAYTAPHGMHWLDDSRLLCTSETARALVEIDADRGEVARAIDAGPHGPHLLAISADRTRAYSANVGSNTVTAFDLVRGIKLHDVEVKAPRGIALSPDGRWLWAGSQADRAVSVIDTNDLRVVKTLPAPGEPYRIAFSPDGQTAVVTEPAAGELAVYDTASLWEMKRIKLGRGKIKFDLRGPAPGPNAVAFAPDGKVVYCTMFASNAVAAVDLTTGEVVGRLSAGFGPDGIAFVPLRAAD